MPLLPPSRRWSDITTVVVFCLLLGLPYVVERLEWGPATGLSERRALAPRPRFDWNWRALAVYPGKYDKYYNDHFGLRSLLVRGYDNLMVRELSTSPKGDVILGKDGWLFYGARNVMDVYRSPDPLTDAELDNWRWDLLLRRDWLARQGIPYVLVVAPDKSTIYPEYLPDWLVPACTETRTDQLVNFLRGTTDLEIVDLRPALRSAKGARLLYHKTDTHWNELGAFVACRELLAHVAHLLPSVRPPELSDYTIRPATRIQGDLAGMLSMNDFFPEVYPSLIPNFRTHATTRPANVSSEEWSRLGLYMAVATETDDPSQPRTVVLIDSYFFAMIPCFAEHFSHAVYLYLRPDRFPAGIIEREHPDIVVQELVERWFGRTSETETKLF